MVRLDALPRPQRHPGPPGASMLPMMLAAAQVLMIKGEAGMIDQNRRLRKDVVSATTISARMRRPVLPN